MAWRGLGRSWSVWLGARFKLHGVEIVQELGRTKAVLAILKAVSTS
jgi:hypothetical protein